MKLEKDVDAERFRAATDRVLRHHPAYSTVFFFDEDTEIRQRYCPEKYEETPLIRLSRAEFEELKGTLVRRFDHLFGSLLHRKAVYQLDNGDVYFFLDTDHLITDGTSVNLVIRQISDCLTNPDAPLPTDYYYLLAEESAGQQKRFAEPDNEVRRHYERVMAPYFEDALFSPAYAPDGTELDLNKKQLIRDLELSREEVRRYVKQNGITENEFFMCCCLLCIAKRNRYPKVALNFIHNGRNSNLHSSSCGLLFHTHTVFADLTGYPRLRDFYEDIRLQAEYGIRNGDFNCCAMNETLSCSVFFLYQKDIFSLDRFPVVEKLLTLPDRDAAADALLEFNVVDSSNAERIGVKLTYGNGFYWEDTITCLYRDFQEIAALLLLTDGETEMGKLLRGK